MHHCWQQRTLACCPLSASSSVIKRHVRHLKLCHLTSQRPGSIRGTKLTLRHGAAARSEQASDGWRTDLCRYTKLSSSCEGFLTAVWVPWHTHARYIVVSVAPMAPPPEFESGGRAADDTGNSRTRLPETCFRRVLICPTRTFGPERVNGPFQRKTNRHHRPDTSLTTQKRTCSCVADQRFKLCTGQM